MNIQKGGEKNFDDYIGKYPNVNKDLIDAFVAMGGNPDKTGFVNSEALRKVDIF